MIFSTNHPIIIIITVIVIIIVIIVIVIIIINVVFLISRDDHKWAVLLVFWKATFSTSR